MLPRPLYPRTALLIHLYRHTPLSPPHYSNTTIVIRLMCACVCVCLTQDSESNGAAGDEQRTTATVNDADDDADTTTTTAARSKSSSFVHFAATDTVVPAPCAAGDTAEVSKLLQRADIGADDDRHQHQHHHHIHRAQPKIAPKTTAEDAATSPLCTPRSLYTRRSADQTELAATAGAAVNGANAASTACRKTTTAAATTQLN